MHYRSAVAGLALTASAIAGAQTVIVGQTYPVKEQSALEEMHQRVGKVDWTKMMRNVSVDDALNAMQRYLPRVTQAGSREYSPYYSLEQDITDKNGNTFYPKGFRYNPLDYFFMPGRVVVIGSDEADLQWLSSVIKSGDRVITAGGDPRKIQAKTGITAFMYDPKMRERLGVEAVPAIVTQKGNRLVIKEMVIDAQPQ